MKDYYIRFGRKYPIPPTIQIKDEIRRMILDGAVIPATPAVPQPPISAADCLTVQETKIQIYQLYFLDRNDVVVTVRAFSGADDSAAVAEGRRLQRAHTIEICCGDRRVDRLEKPWRFRLATPDSSVAEITNSVAQAQLAVSEPAPAASRNL